MTDDTTIEETMRAAIGEIRREGFKAAGLHALVDGVLFALAGNLAVAVVGLQWFDQVIGLPGVALTSTTGSVLVIAAGIAVFVIEIAVRIRQPLVERFEAVNPAVDEALRTARDALDRDDDSRVARALYADVIARLQATSSLGLINTRRLVVSVVLIFILSIATIHVSVIAIDVGDSTGPVPSGGENGISGGTDQATPGTSELQSGDEVLGEPEDVTSGSKNLSAPVAIEQGGPGDEEFERFETDEETSPSSSESVRRAGYAPPEDVEDADLIREYNLRIREDDDD